MRFPNNTNRVTVIGATGSGKTQFGLWLLGTRKSLDFVRRPVVMFDFKLDDMIDEIDPIEIGINEKPPKRAELYVTRPHGDDEMDAIDLFLTRCWAQEDIGLYIDEGAELEKSKRLRRVLTQGRSKHIPVITLTQRPVFLPRPVFSEADYFAVLRLNDKRDYDTVKGFVNADVAQRRLPFHSLWYDVGQDRATLLKPVPDRGEIIRMLSVERHGTQRRKRAL